MSAADDPLSSVSRETLSRLQRLSEELARWTPAINLVARGTLADRWSRHILDSAQVWALRPPGARRWADFGSGGGFPGLVVAILAAEQDPGLQVTLVESDQRKAAFLRHVLRDTGVTAQVLSDRVEALDPLNADVVSARALAPLDRLCELTLPHLAPGGVALFPKGARHAEEVATARRSWRFQLDSVPSLTDPQGVVLKMKGLTRV
ncbi:MAG: 16S rRNA (guanine(527)-N(7))-methyltransferase RsmG [Rhodobacterales bacterium]|nr:16S rRNA (guanine(527)-N(7))-methyltransferase RsmG [Rhodobacterales bacterium]